MSKSRETPNPTRQDRLRYEFQRNKKKTAILGALMLVALVLASRLIFKKSPAKAQAQGSAVVSSQVATAAPTPQRAPVRVVPEGQGPREAPAPKPLTAPPAEFTRDLFKPNVQYFPDALKEVEGGKSAPAPRDAERRVLKEAESLRLTSTMMGAVPCATINGQILRVNDQVGGFQIVEITQWSCDLVRKGIRVRIEMDR